MKFEGKNMINSLDFIRIFTIQHAFFKEKILLAIRALNLIDLEGIK
jgi:hypothetical protein